MADFTREMSNYKFIKDYAKWRDDLSRYETWDESVDRVINMHRTKYADKLAESERLGELIDFATHAYKDKLVLASQRSLQFGGEPTLKKEGRMYNCLTSYCDRPKFFQEAMWWLLLGGGVGFSVQKHHVERLPEIAHLKQDPEAVVYVVPDSIEGWSDAFGVLLSSYFKKDQPFPEYFGKAIHFDYSEIRPEGSLISGGFKAPGPDGLKASIDKVRSILAVASLHGEKLRPIDCYDIVMHMSDAVLSGGVRRSATICLFSPDDEEMLKAKTGNWFEDNPQRGRSNNSALLVRSETSRELYDSLFESIKQFGEPGIVWADSTEFIFNPCVEIGFKPVAPSGKSSWQGCNLTEINGGKTNSRESLMRAVKAATILGTLQAGFTTFSYLDDDVKATFEAEALLGVSITGWMENAKVLFDKDLLDEAAKYAVKINEEVAALIGINPAARVTCTKPSGNASVLLGTSSGIHPHHSKRYFRNVQGNINEDVVKEFMEINPDAVEVSFWNPNGKDVILSFPVIAPEGSKFKDELLGIKLLEHVKIAQNSWVESGTVESRCTDSRLRHNISNTITVDDWDEVQEYVWENREHFAGISFLSMSGDKDYVQAPFIEVKTPEELIEEYGVASILASGLVVDALNAFNDNLWKACDIALGVDEGGLKELKHASSRNALRRDWMRRFDQFANRFFEGDIRKTTYLLKDVHLLHKWEKVTRTMTSVDWLNADLKPEFLDVSTTGAMACSGGVCEITF